MTKQRRLAIERIMRAASRYMIEALATIHALDDGRKEFNARAAQCLVARQRLRRIVRETVH